LPWMDVGEPKKSRPADELFRDEFHGGSFSGEPGTRVCRRNPQWDGIPEVFDHGTMTESVVQRYLATARPTHVEIIETARRLADVIVFGGGCNDGGIDQVIQKIKSFAGAGENLA
jgi:hypothetical protein